MAQISLSEIAQQLAEDTRSSPHDGVSNAERVNFILNMFEVDAIDLNDHFSFDKAWQCDDPEMVEAFIHLAILQRQYVTGVSYAGYLTEEQGEVRCGWLSLQIAKMHWHLTHLKQNKPTPPFRLH